MDSSIRGEVILPSNWKSPNQVKFLYTDSDPQQHVIQGGVMVKALVSHTDDPGSIPRGCIEFCK